jgi:hypothetical protein
MLDIKIFKEIYPEFAELHIIKLYIIKENLIIQTEVEEIQISFEKYNKNLGKYLEKQEKKE